MTRTSDRLNVDLLMEALSEILSDKYGAKVTMRAIPKEKKEEKSACTKS